MSDPTPSSKEAMEVDSEIAAAVADKEPRREPLMDDFPTDEQVEKLATTLSDIYRYRWYLGPHPSEAHRDKARAILAQVKNEIEASRG